VVVVLVVVAAAAAAVTAAEERKSFVSCWLLVSEPDTRDVVIIGPSDFPYTNEVMPRINTV
jgi:hypothetical protein